VLRAAVIVPIVRRPEPTIVFVKRAAFLRRNPGQIAFPGGALDAGDGDDPELAALREFEEELGVPRDRVRIVARLDDVTTLAINAHVTPFVGILDPPPAWTLDHETESVHEVPLAALYAAGAVHEADEHVVHEGRRFTVRTWMFDYDGLHVWGATGRMLHALLTRYPALSGLPLR
jgi:8-oxo-dGTP pyrophosphatase MutT (NUDIX family)